MECCNKARLRYEQQVDLIMVSVKNSTFSYISRLADVKKIDPVRLTL
jgi:hypothetical protein